MTDARFVTWRVGDKVHVVGVLEGAAAAAFRYDRRRFCGLPPVAAVSIACALAEYGTAPPDFIDYAAPDRLLTYLRDFGASRPVPTAPPLSRIALKALRLLADGESHAGGPVTTDTLVSGKPARKLVELGYATMVGSYPTRFTITVAGRTVLASQPAKRARP